MAEGMLMICMIQLTSIVAQQGLDEYLKHRKHVIKNGKEETLISYKIKKSMDNIQRKMTPEKQRSSTISTDKASERPSSYNGKKGRPLSFDLSKIYKSSYNSDGPEMEEPLLEAVVETDADAVEAEPVAYSLKRPEEVASFDFQAKKEKASNEVTFGSNKRTSRIFDTGDFITENPLSHPSHPSHLKKSHHSAIHHPETSHSTTHKPTTTNKFTDKLKRFVNDITPSKIGLSKVEDSNPEFKKFVADILLFVLQEYELQKETKNEIMLKQKDYNVKLMQTILKKINKNIIIYSHMPEFSFKEGTTVVQYVLADILEKCGQNVRIYSSSGIETQNSIFSKFYKNDFPIDDNAVVIYCEVTQGNPLGAKNVVRWILNKYRRQIPAEIINTWGKNELVYFFNYKEEEKEKEATSVSDSEAKGTKEGKMLNAIYLHPCASNFNLNPRKGTCFTVGKAMDIHGKIPQFTHPPYALEITKEYSQLDCIKMFNNHKFFISYDSLTFLTIISALCGCVAVVIKVEGVLKQDWLNTTVAAEYLKESGEMMLYGIAYGAEDLQNAVDTIHLAKEQWDRIVSYSKEKYVANFIEDVNDWSSNTNTIQNEFY